MNETADSDQALIERLAVDLMDGLDEEIELEIEEGDPGVTDQSARVKYFRELFAM